jgi:hypothetical protein
MLYPAHGPCDPHSEIIQVASPRNQIIQRLALGQAIFLFKLPPRV